ncbi:MAG TPA: RNA polymerase sigma-70 factor [Gemmatimonadaceae bacterium]
MPVERVPTGGRDAADAMSSLPDPTPELLAHWIARIADGDAVAFESLFHAFYDRLCVYAETYVRSPHAAEEIVDDVFLALWAGRERLRPQRAVASYLYVAVRNRALNQLRRRKMEHQYFERTELEFRVLAADDRNDVEDAVRSSELFALAERAIEALPERIRETYLLYYQHGLSYAEIAAVMNVSVRTVENQLARAVKRLWRGLHGMLE